ncbi:hypothetical protein R1sor_020267 [Riccia sorocarpa]|uniref:AAA+ ATPase domain-containing protein n=1 Tax=Riccia sorocarpa TaxID=122646 RepID=A0ABD3IIN8_9MARC
MASHVTLDEKWGEGMKEMLTLFEEEVLLTKPKQDNKNRQKKNKTPAPTGLPEWSTLYFKYLQVYTKLEDCYDQFMVILNEGGEYFDFSDLLLSRKQSHDVLNILPPRFLTDDKKTLLETREKSLIAALTTHELINVPEPPKPPSGLTIDEAAIIVQAEERGRRARFKIAEIQRIRIRGFLGRVRTRRAALDELTFIGMNNFQPPDLNDPRKQLAAINDKRKRSQLENELELQNATCTTLEKIKDLEGQEMCEIIQERINVYLNEHREPETGMCEGLPKKKDGGSAAIIDPLQPLERPVQEKDKAKGDGKQRTKGGQVPPPKFPDPDPDGPPKCPDYFRRFVKESHDLYRKHWFDKDDYDNYEQNFVPDLLKQSLRPIAFEEMRLLTDENTKQLLKSLKKKTRLEKKARIKQLLKQAKKEGKEKEFKARLKAEKAQEKKDMVAAKKAKKEREKEKQKEAGGLPPPPKKPKRKKDSSMNRSLESIFDELAKNGILQLCPNRQFSEYVGAENYTAAPPKPGWAAQVDPSMAQVKRQVIEYCIFPLATEMVSEKAPFVNSILLYGGVGVGKTLLVHAACRAAGCTYFDLSPRNTNGKFQGGKRVAQMVQMTFKLAKIMAPSIVYIDDIEKVFISAKKKIKSWGMKDKPNRIKRALSKEMKGIWPGDRVMVIGCTNRPQDMAGKTGPNKKTQTFLKFFSKRIYCPYPDYASRLMVWRTLLERHQAQLKYGFDVAILASYSKDFSVSNIEQVIEWGCTQKRIRSDFGKPPPPPEEVLQKGGQKKGGKPPAKKGAEAAAK